MPRKYAKALAESGCSETVSFTMPRPGKDRLDGLVHKLRRSRIRTMPPSMCVRLLLTTLFEQFTEDELVEMLEGKEGYSRSWYDKEQEEDRRRLLYPA